MIKLLSTYYIAITLLAFSTFTLAEQDLQESGPIHLELTEDGQSEWVKVQTLERMQKGRTLEISEKPKKGKVEFKGVRLQYTPNKNEFGNDVFSVIICKSNASCVVREIYIKIKPVNDPPTESFLAITIKENKESQWQMPLIVDNDDDRFELQATTIPDNLRIITNGRAFKVRAKPGWSGITAFNYRVCDLKESCIDKKASVTVLPNMRDDNGAIPDIALPILFESNKGKTIVTHPFEDSESGNIIDSRSSVYIELDSKSRHSIFINNSEIKPGENAYISQYDFAVLTGRVAFTARLNNMSSIKPGQFGLLRVSINDPYVPDQIYRLVSWDIYDQLKIRSSYPVVNPGQIAWIEIDTKDKLHCHELLVWEDNIGAPLRNDQACAISFKSSLQNITIQEQGRRIRIAGVVPQSEKAFFEYTPGMVMAVKNKQEFYPAATSQTINWVQ